MTLFPMQIENTMKVQKHSRVRNVSPRARIDFATIAAAARPYLPELAARWLPSGKRCGPYWRCGSIAGDPGQSFLVHVAGPRAGLFVDFADRRVRGSDAIALAAAVFGISQTEAARRLAAMLGVRAEVAA